MSALLTDHPEAYHSLIRILAENKLLREKNDELIKENGVLRSQINSRKRAQKERAFDRRLERQIKALQKLKLTERAAK